jgi:hypothetical protein
MDVRAKRATAYDDPTAEELPSIAEELPQMSFRALMERSGRQFQADQEEYPAGAAEAHEDQEQ